MNAQKKTQTNEENLFRVNCRFIGFTEMLYRWVGTTESSKSSRIHSSLKAHA